MTNTLDKWDYRFYEIAKVVSQWSKDPSLKVGALIVKNRRIISQGYNGLPSKIEDSEERLSNRDLKLKLTVHAEVNAILNAASNDTSTEGSTLYVTCSPCSNCASCIINAGIIRIVCPPINPNIIRWKENFELSRQIFKEANLTVIENLNEIT